MTSKISIKNKRNKKALSEIVSYILLILIATTLAVGVYEFLKNYVPSEQEKEKCPDQAALSLIGHNCNKILDKFSITIENTGNFDIDGFFIKASSNYSKIPINNLNSTDASWAGISGRYDFLGRLKLDASAVAGFSYSGLNKIERLNIQPFIKAGNKSLFLCSNVIDLKIENC